MNGSSNPEDNQARHYINNYEDEVDLVKQTLAFDTSKE